MANYNSLKNAGIAKPTGNISLGSDSSRYTDIFLSGNVNIGSTSLTSTNAVAPRGTTKVMHDIQVTSPHQQVHSLSFNNN